MSKQIGALQRAPKISASCTHGDHCRCFMLACECAQCCHGKPLKETVVYASDGNNRTTGRHIGRLEGR